MSPGLAVVAAVTGGGGAVARFVVDGSIRARWPGRALPWATIVINVSGSLLLGVLTGLVVFQAAPSSLAAIAGTGFCGGYTTFSTASFETVRLIQQRAGALALANAIGTALLTIAAAGLGLFLAH